MSLIRLDRYVLRLFFIQLLVALVAMLALYLGIDLIEKLRWLSRRDGSPGAIAGFLWCRVPLALSHVTPFASLLAGVLTTMILNRRNELTALRAAGIAPCRFVLPLLAGSSLTGLALWMVTEFWLPLAESALLEPGNDGVVGRTVKGAGRRSGWFAESDRYYHAGEIRDGRTLRDLEVLWIEPSGRLREHVVAPAAVWKKGRWYALGADIRTFAPDGTVRFKSEPRHLLPLSMKPADIRYPRPDPDQYRYQELKEEIRRRKAGGRDVGGLVAALELRRLLPLSCVLLVLIGAPRGARAGRIASTSGAVGQALGVGVTYLLVTGAGILVARLEPVSPAVAIWVPQVLWFVSGVVGLARLR